VRGSPVIWKELRSSVVGSRFVGFVTWLAAAGVLGLIYALTWQDVLRYSEGHTVFAVVLMALSLGVTAIITPTGIAREREAGTWPLLLATPLEASQIVAGKAVALVRRSLPVWSLLGLHLVLFTCLGRIHPAALAHVGILAASMLVLLTGSGLFWSTCVRKATWAVILNLAFCAAIWFVLPMFLSMGSGMFLIMAGSRSHGMFLQSLVMALYMVHPLVQVGMTVNGAAGQAAAGRALWALKYDWASGDLGVTEYTLIVVVVALVYIALGLLMARAASRRLRKNAF
jgi:ABC-type transport system involved in multi-copper enzyme maturation permease subunit